MNRGDRGGREDAAADAAGNMYGECAQAELKSPHESNLGPAAETSLVKVTLSERKSSPKCGELRECGEGMSSRYKSKMSKKGTSAGFGTRHI